MEDLDSDMTNVGSGTMMMMINESLPNPFENCTYFDHCRADELSDTSISCPHLWTVFPPKHLNYSPYIAAVQAVYFAIAYFWNLFILISYAVHRSLLKEPANIYLFNLALTDLLLAIFVILQCFITEARKAFLVGETDIVRCGICEFLGFMIMFLMASTLHTLAMLSFDRFFLLIRPLSYQQFFNWKKALLVVVCIWVLSFLIAIPPFFGLGTYFFSFTISNCHPQWSGKSFRGLDNFHYIVMVGAEAVIPILFLTFTNIVTYRIVTKVLRKKLKRQESFSEKKRESRAAHNRQQLQLVKVFGALFLAHIICWVPVLVVVAVAFVVDPTTIPIEVYIFCWLLYLTNPVVHPILETFFVKDLRARVNSAQKSVRSSIRRVSSMGSSFIQKQASSSSLRPKRESIQSENSTVTKASVISKNSLTGSVSQSPSVSSDPVVGSFDSVRLPLSPSSRSEVTFTILEEAEPQMTPPTLRANGGVSEGVPHPPNSSHHANHSFGGVATEVCQEKGGMSAPPTSSPHHGNRKISGPPTHKAFTNPMLISRKLSETAVTSDL